MSFARSEVVSVTTAADGTATAYTSDIYNGWIDVVAYTADGTSPFAATADFTITTETTGQNVWVESNVTGSKTVAPRQATHDTAGVASLYAGGGEPVESRVRAVDERLKIAIAQGGDTKVGSFRVVVVS